MAFKILSYDELELLTENQRKCYEEELAIYNERVRFVEQMERFENTVITPYEPKFVVIPDISKALDKEFVKPEDIFVKISPVVKPDPGVAAVCFDGSVTAVVPKLAKIKNVPIGHMEKMEQCNPILPVILKAVAPANFYVKAERQSPVMPANVKVSIPGNTFKKLEHISPNLPIAVKPQNFTGVFYTPVIIDSLIIMENKPELANMVFEAPIFSVPKYVIPVLPRHEVEVPEMKRLESVAEVSPVLPKVIVPRQASVAVKQIDEINVKLPKDLGAATINVSFDKPEINVKLPKGSGAATVNVSFDKPDIHKAELPAFQKTVIPEKEYVKTEYAVSDLPVVDMPQISFQLYTTPELREIRLPIMKPDMTPKSFSDPKPLKEIHSKVTGLPIIYKVDHPDVGAEELHKIKLLLLKENEIKEDFA